MQNRRVVFMGTPDFAVPALRAIHGAGHEVLGVYTQPDKPAGRGRTLTPPPVKVAAQELGLPLFQPNTLRDEETQRVLKALAPEVIVVAAYAQLLPQSVLNIPNFGCKNIHASLLPRYRGGAPIHWAVVNGETETGVTIMQMAKGLDTGDMIAQKATPIGLNDTCGDLFKRLALLGAEMMLDVLSLPDLGESKRVPQDHSLSSFARNVRKEDGLIDWSRNAEQIHNLVRGFNPWPGTYTHFNGQPLRVISSQLCADDQSLAPGEAAIYQNKFLVGCGTGTLELLQVQPAGKKIMTAQDFSRGYINKGVQTLRFG